MANTAGVTGRMGHIRIRSSIRCFPRKPFECHLLMAHSMSRETKKHGGLSMSVSQLPSGSEALIAHSVTCKSARVTSQSLSFNLILVSSGAIAKQGRPCKVTEAHSGYRAVFSANTLISPRPSFKPPNSSHEQHGPPQHTPPRNPRNNMSLTPPNNNPTPHLPIPPPETSTPTPKARHTNPPPHRPRQRRPHSRNDLHAPQKRNRLPNPLERLHTSHLGRF